MFDIAIVAFLLPCVSVILSVLASTDNRPAVRYGTFVCGCSCHYRDSQPLKYLVLSSYPPERPGEVARVACGQAEAEEAQSPDTPGQVL